MAEITYICKRTVVSTKPVQPGKYCSLSVLDRLMEKNHLRIVYYYPSTRDHLEPGEVTKKLRESLAEMLTCFPIVTGRLLKDEKDERWMIKCNDAGVRMVEARAKGTVEDWLRNVDREKELKLVHWEVMYHKPYFWSTFYVQLTEFEEGGLAIGLSCIHLLADLTCAHMFIKAWADKTLTQKMLTPPFFHPLPPRRPGNKNPHHRPYAALINHYKSHIKRPVLPSTTDPKHATITLSFTDLMVRACIDMGRVHMSRPSPFDALAGLFWVCVSKVKGMSQSEGPLVDMSVCLDMRKVLGLDKGYFGNCMVYNKVPPPEAQNNKLFTGAVMAIREVVEKMDSEGVVDLIEWLENNDDRKYPPSMNGHDLVCTSLEWLDPYPYLTMFEEGVIPSRVSSYVEPLFGLGQILVLPSPSGDGPLSRMVMVTLPDDEVIKLLDDELIQRFCPTIVMRTNGNVSRSLHKPKIP